MTRQEKIEYIAALRERLIREARTDLLPFTRATIPTFDPAEFHVRYYHVLTLFAEGKIKKPARQKRRFYAPPSGLYTWPEPGQ